MHILICGEVGVGKSTLINTLLKDIPVKYGFITKIEREKPDADGTMYVYMHSPADKTRAYTKDNCVGSCKAVKGSSKSFEHVFNTLGVRLLSNIPKGSIVLMDEIGFMERNSKLFLDKIEDVFNSDCTVIAAIKPKHLPYLDRLRSRSDVSLFYLKKTNRDDILKSASECLKHALGDKSVITKGN